MNPLNKVCPKCNKGMKYLHHTILMTYCNVDKFNYTYNCKFCNIFVECDIKNEFIKLHISENSNLKFIIYNDGDIISINKYNTIITKLNIKIDNSLVAYRALENLIFL